MGVNCTRELGIKEAFCFILLTNFSGVSLTYIGLANLCLFDSVPKFFVISLYISSVSSTVEGCLLSMKSENTLNIAPLS